MKKVNSFVVIVDILIFIIAFFLLVFVPVNKVIHVREVTITVTDKGIKNQGKSGKYLIYGKDENGKTMVVEITDSLLNFRFNSSDLYANIEVDKTYKCLIKGYRINIFSIYPNLYKIEEIKEKD